MSIKDLANKIAPTVDAKGAAYGNAIKFSEVVFKELYPNGVPVDSFSNMLLIVRVLDKLKRLSTDPNAFGENPWEDITGYALRGAEITENKEREKILNHDFQIGPTTYNLPVKGFWSAQDLIGINSVVRGEPRAENVCFVSKNLFDTLQESEKALSKYNEAQKHLEHVKAHEQFIKGEAFIKTCWDMEITDEDVYMAVDVLAEILAEPTIEDGELFDECWYTLQDLGWSNDDLFKTARRI